MIEADRMIHRRLFMKMAAASALLLSTPAVWSVAWAASDDQATAFIKRLSERLTGVVNGPGNEADKRLQMKQIIDHDVDVEAVGRFCLGRFWNTATPDQRQEYLRLFHDVLVNSINSHLGEYSGVRITLGRTVPGDDQATVSSTVERPNNPPAEVKWIVGFTSDGPKVVDVVAEGTSLRLTQREDYASYLLHNGSNVQKLIAAMKQQLSQNS
jgi:phospholipid transport system substrate-binding protein